MKKKRWERGSATVEMSILMPLIVILLLLLIYLLFYLYDRTVLYCDAYRASIYGISDPEEDNSGAWIKSKEQMEENMKDQLLALPSPEIEVTVDHNGVTIGYRGTVEVPIAEENVFFPDWNGFFIAEEVSAKRHRPVTFIRQCRKLERLMKLEETNEDERGTGNGENGETAGSQK